MQPLTDGAVITVPGVYDIPAELYHSDPVPGGSLSCSGARKLLPPHCPARFRYEQDHHDPAATTPALDFGSVAHRLVLGAGPDVVPVDAADWRTKAAKEARADAYEQGALPLLVDDVAKVEAMATALRAHPLAAALFAPESGRPEQSLFWPDQQTGVWRRARLDWLPHPVDGRMVLADYKTCRTASPTELPRAINEHGYHQQAAWYLDGVRALGLDRTPAFLFVFQEKEPPYLVTVVEPSGMALAIGNLLNLQAIRTYRDCVASGQWPGYSDDVELLGLPPWVESIYAQEFRR